MVESQKVTSDFPVKQKMVSISKKTNTHFPKKTKDDNFVGIKLFIALTKQAYAIKI